jgi:hypothetical protein
MAEKDDQYIGTDSILREFAKKGHELEFFFVPSGGSANPLSVKFLAFLTQLEDSYSSDWTSDKVYGRMDPIATFQGTIRTISLGWSVPAYSGEEAKNNLLKMSKLISMCYPVYGGQNTSARGASQISGAPLIKLKFANLISGMNSSSGDSDKLSGAAQNGLLGWINGISFTPNLEAGFFDPSPGLLFPKQIDLSCQFNALHQHALGWTRSLAKESESDSDASGAAASGLRKQEGTKNFPYGSSFTAGGKYASVETPKINQFVGPPMEEEFVGPPMEEEFVGPPMEESPAAKKAAGITDDLLGGSGGLA